MTQFYSYSSELKRLGVINTIFQGSTTLNVTTNLTLMLIKYSTHRRFNIIIKHNEEGVGT